MKPLAYLPHDNSDLPKEVIATLDELVDGRELSADTAIGRVSGTKRWVVLFDDGDEMVRPKVEVAGKNYSVVSAKYQVGTFICDA